MCSVRLGHRDRLVREKDSELKDSKASKDHQAQEKARGHKDSKASKAQ